MKALLILLSLLVVSFEASAQNWFRTMGPVEDDVHDLAIDSNGILYAVTPMGVNRSTNGGEHWTRPFRFPTIETISRVVVTTNGNIVVCAGSNIYVSTDTANTFIRSYEYPLPGTNPIYRFAISGSGRVFAGRSGGMLYSDNHGLSWLHISSESKVIGDRPLAVAASQDTIVAHGIFYTHISFNNGDDWITRNPAAGVKAVHTMRILCDGRWVAVDEYKGLLQYSTDGQWLRYDGHPDAVIYTAEGLRDGSMLVGTSKGFVRVTNTSKWIDINSGFDQYASLAPAQRFVEDSYRNIYYVATLGAGVWKSASVLQSAGDAQPPARFSISPNPFTDRTTIHFPSPNPSSTEIELRNILGAVVWKKPREYTAAGTNTLPIEVSGIPAGNYLLVRRTNDRTETQWVTIVQ